MRDRPDLLSNAYDLHGTLGNTLRRVHQERRTELPDYKWSPSLRSTDQERAIDLAAIGPLYESQWKIAKEHLPRYPQRIR